EAIDVVLGRITPNYPRMMTILILNKMTILILNNWRHKLPNNGIGFCQDLCYRVASVLTCLATSLFLRVLDPSFPLTSDLVGLTISPSSSQTLPRPSCFATLFLPPLLPVGDQIALPSSASSF